MTAKKKPDARPWLLYIATDAFVVRLFKSRDDPEIARRTIGDIGLTALKANQDELQGLVRRGAVVENLRAAIERKWQQEDDEARDGL